MAGGTGVVRRRVVPSAPLHLREGPLGAGTPSPRRTSASVVPRAPGHFFLAESRRHDEEGEDGTSLGTALSEPSANANDSRRPVGDQGGVAQEFQIARHPCL